MNNTRHLEPEHIRAVAVPINAIQLLWIKGEEGQEEGSFVIWIDIKNRPDLVGLSYQPGQETRSYWMYDEDIFYVVIERGGAFQKDFSLPISVSQYKKELKCLSKNDLVLLIAPGIPVDPGASIYFILSIPPTMIQRQDLQATLQLRESYKSHFN